MSAYNDSTGKYIGKFVFPMLLWTCVDISISSVISNNPALLIRVNVGVIQERAAYMKFIDIKHSHVWKVLRSSRYCFLIDSGGLFNINFRMVDAQRMASELLVDLDYFRVTYYAIIWPGYGILFEFCGHIHP